MVRWLVFGLAIRWLTDERRLRAQLNGFALYGRVEDVGMANSNQILRHDLSCNGLQAGRLPAFPT